MNDPSQPPLFLDDAISVPLARSFQKVSLWLVGGVGAATAGMLLVFAVATQSGADAERIAGSQGDGLKGLISAIAATHGRPGAL
ncbi:MAG: hypothetical protein K2Y56_15400 [Methylobacterium sp.]|uniref:hypothetical protein n=1 Tax=Methylobacterium sp. TaxID=409 RepID=UPI0025FBCE7F|nr:hypothetical protein [Methylobacterium sp.]MBX9932902.1 hypothetical protein [Methylobacterium sp.]